MDVFAENLKRIREDAGVSQTDLADAVGTSQQYISALEHGQSIPRIDMARKIKQYLNVAYEDLLEDIDG